MIMLTSVGKCNGISRSFDNLLKMNEEPQKYLRKTVSQVMETNIIIELQKFQRLHNEAVFLGNNLKASAIQGQQ